MELRHVIEGAAYCGDNAGRRQVLVTINLVHNLGKLSIELFVVIPNGQAA